MELQQFAYKTPDGTWKLVSTLFEHKRDSRRYLDSKNIKYLRITSLTTFTIEKE